MLPTTVVNEQHDDPLLHLDTMCTRRAYR